MKTFIKKISLLCLVILFASTIKAQTIFPGTSCASSYLLNTSSGPASGSDSVQQGSSVGWFAVYATSSSLLISANI